jgi:uncharacterized membrane protein YcfT
MTQASHLADNMASQALTGSRPVMGDLATPAPGRVAWIDGARGWCIILVVMMHSALGVGVAVGDSGWLHDVVAFAKPFRMPDFFLIAGLFAARAIDGPWRRFFDRKVVHFAYFYALWLLVALIVKAPSLGIEGPEDFAATYLWRLVQPFSTTWFIQLLPILYLATRAVRGVRSPVLFAFALALHYVAAAFPTGGAYAMESQATGWTTLDGFLLFWVYFLIGVRYRTIAFRVADWASSRPFAGVAALIVWGCFEAWATSHSWPEVYGLDLPFGLLGAAAVVVAAALAARLRAFSFLSAIGRQSLIIYLAFFLPMAVTRTILLKVFPGIDVGLASLLVTVAAIIAPLVLERISRRTPLAFLFHRPRQFAMLPLDRVGEGKIVSA